MSTALNQRSLDPTPEDRAKIITVIKRVVAERHINVSNPNQDYKPWLDLVEKQTPRLMEEDREGFEATISGLLSALGSSHTAFFHKRRDNVPALYSINATLRTVETIYGKRWMFVDVIEDGVAFQAGIRPGEILLSIDSVPVILPNSPTFDIGGNHQTEIASVGGVKRQVTIRVPNRPAKDRPPMVEPRSISHRFLGPDIGYVRAATFPGAIGQEFANNLDKVIREFNSNGVRRLIVDVRGNCGGGVGSLRLMSYLCSDKKKIGYSLTRHRLRKGYRKEDLPRLGWVPSNKAGLVLIFLRFKVFEKDRSVVLVTEGLGPQPFHGRIVLLANEFTHSAAELVASFAKENRLATLVGIRTAGEVTGGANFTLPGGYTLRIPVAVWYTWQGDSIEGKGVESDVVIDNGPESLANGTDAQLEKAVEIAKSL